MNTDETNGRIGRDFHSALIIPHSSLLFLAADESRSNVRRPGMSRIIKHEELAEVIGTG